MKTGTTDTIEQSTGKSLLPKPPDRPPLGKVLWQVGLALFFIGMAVYFIRHEEVELRNVLATAAEADIFFIVGGLFCTLTYIACQAGMYAFSLKAIGQEAGIFSLASLYLKRNFVSVFLPAGAFTSLMFFNSQLEKQGVSKPAAYYSAYLYSLAGLLSVVLLALPVLGFMVLKDTLTATEIIAFAAILLLTALLVWVVRSFLHGSWARRLMQRHNPQVMEVVEGLKHHKMKAAPFAWAVFMAVGTEVAGVAHVYIALHSLGLGGGVEESAVVYLVMVMLLIASPFLRGIGAIEVSVTYILTTYGYETVDAAAVTLLFRLFNFWLVFLLGFLFYTANRTRKLYFSFSKNHPPPNI